MDVREAISEMTSEVRAGTEAEARRLGLSLDDFMTMKLTQNLTDDELDSVAGARRNRTEYYDAERAIDQE